MPQHQRSREWLDAHINGMARVAMPWPSLLGFVRLVTNPRIFDRPSAMSAAWRQVESWLAGDTVWIPLPTDRHREVLAALIPAAEGRANLVPDAHLAALAIEHGLTLCSADGDFARFEGLAWENRLA
ncbi:MAG: type II toxin-antitoxin system VapC family toxin [Gammaproteobacteria bacterium]|nr:type II toxin-antitoxin system VapC family toxin [Gammaproteobacteria bacterium]